MKWLTSIIIAMLLTPFVASLSVDFVSPTPTNGSTIVKIAPNKDVEVDVNFTMFNKTQTINLTINNNLYNIFDSNLGIFWNFNNNSLLGENQTLIIDNGYFKQFNLTLRGNDGHDFLTGRYNKGLYANGSADIREFKDSYFNNSDYVSFCLWVNINLEPTDAYQIFFRERDSSVRNGEIGMYVYNSTNNAEVGKLYIEYWNQPGTAVLSQSKTTYSINGTGWQHICTTYDDTYTYLYHNGTLVYSATYVAGVYNHTNKTGNFQWHNDFNGTVDDFIYIHRKINASEAELIYKSSLERIDTFNYTFRSNITTLNISSNKINICANDTTSQGCSYLTYSYNFLTTLNVSSSILGIINPYFYGTNTHGSWLGTISVVYPWGNATSIASNYTFHREAFLQSKMNIIRWDAGFGSYYTGLGNLGFEMWNSTSLICTNFTVGSWSTYPLKIWTISSANQGNGSACFSYDAVEGNKSLNVTNTGGGATFFPLIDIVSDYGTGLYNITFNARSNIGNNIGYSVQNKTGSYHSVCSGGLIEDGNWHYYSCAFNISDWSTAPNGLRFIPADLNKGNSTLIDNVSITLNGAPLRKWYFNGNLDNRKSQMEWLNTNNIKVILISDYMPLFLANWSVSGCNVNYTSECPPEDYNVLGEINVDYINRITDNGTLRNIEVEVWNEPDIGYLLELLPTDHINKSIEYNKIYNATRTALKSNFSWMSVYGAGMAGVYRSNMTTNFLSNFSNYTDAFSFHRYSSATSLITNQLDDFNMAFGNCTLYSNNCSRLVYSEWQLTGGGYNLADSYLGAYFSLGYWTGLNYYPANISYIQYQWSDSRIYNSSSGYSEYPSRWTMVTEDAILNGTDNASRYRPQYNITKQFATYHPSGATVINSTSDYDKIKVVASKLSNVRMVTVINTDTDSVNVTLSLGDNVTTLYQAGTGTIYTQHNDGLFYLGAVESYAVNSYYGSVAYPYRVEELCNATLQGLGTFGDMLPIIITVMVGSLIMLFLAGGGKGADLEIAGVAIVTTAVAVVIGGQIISKTAGC